MSKVDDLKTKVKTGKEKKPIESLFATGDNQEETDQEQVPEIEEVTEVVEEVPATEEVAAANEDKEKEDGDQSMENLVKELTEILKKDDEKKKKAKPEMVGIYFDTDVKEGLDKYQSDNGRGAKSELLNSLARLALNQMGYLKKSK